MEAIRAVCDVLYFDDNHSFGNLGYVLCCKSLMLQLKRGAWKVSVNTIKKPRIYLSFRQIRGVTPKTANAFRFKSLLLVLRFKEGLSLK